MRTGERGRGACVLSFPFCEMFATDDGKMLLDYYLEARIRDVNSVVLPRMIPAARTFLKKAAFSNSV